MILVPRADKVPDRRFARAEATSPIFRVCGWHFWEITLKVASMLVRSETPQLRVGQGKRFALHTALRA